MTLRQKQSAFALALARLILWINDQGWEVTLGEGYVGDTDARDGDYDGPHKRDGLHYKRLAVDLNLFVEGQWITNGAHKVWQAIGAHWEAMDSLARWGGRFQSGDANHLSFSHEGKA